MKTGQITLEWDIHSGSAPYESDRWAASDRGWLFARIDRGNVYGGSYVNLGHYLAYSPGYEGHDRDFVHAHSTVTRESSWHETAEQAKAWLDAQASDGVPRFFAECHRSAGGYQHRADEIAALPVSR